MLYARWSRSLPILLITGLILLASVSQAAAWWDQSWGFRKKLTLSAGNAGIAESLDDVPLLVRLHSANFDFTMAKPDGSDLRFVAADEKTPLPYHVEQWNPEDELALVWVKVPRLTAGTVPETIWLYWGNPRAVSAEDAGAGFDANQALIYHFDTVEGAPRDATAYRNHAGAFSGGTDTPGPIGRAVSLNGGGDHIQISRSPSLDFAAGFSFSTWVRLAEPLDQAYLFSIEDDENALVIGIEQTRPFVRVTRDGRTIKTALAGDLTPGNWQQLAVTIDPENEILLYLDGREAGSGGLPFPMPELASDLAVGVSLRGNHSFRGDLDQLELARTARSASWIAVAYQSQGPENLLTSHGEIEAGEGGGVSNLLIATVAGNITADGWIIIGILFLLGAVSGVLFVNKAYSYRLMARENHRFMQSFRGMKDLARLRERPEEFRNSPLYRIFQKGIEDLQGWAERHAHIEEPRMSRKALNIFRNVLENGFMEENRRVNSGLIILTLAISGGPFLGLLGTVWGVMNTFAALAVAGEANLSAIAPGVASALATTVFGLVVAIPALFGYNFLASRVKLIAADLMIFVDQFANLVDQEFGED